MKARSFDHSASVPTLGLVLDGAEFLYPPPDAFAPFVPNALNVEPWPLGTVTGTDLLAWLGGAFTQRPLLGLTGRALWDSEGVAVRGLSPLGSGVALVSTRSLTPESLLGVVRHEVGHAFGMDHCECWDCALSQRPHPLPVQDRPPAFCPRCQERWDALCRSGKP